MRLIPVTAYYSGNQGTYISVMPSADTVSKLRPLYDALVPEAFPELHPPLNWHCTVIYSKQQVPNVHDLHQFYDLSADRKFTASADHVTWWPGHNEEGYVVLKLQSEELAELHHQLKDLGLKTNFPDYEAHVTLVEHALKHRSAEELHALVARLNMIVLRELTAEPLTFIGLKLEDAK